jgi:hypothetical protein
MDAFWGWFWFVLLSATWAYCAWGLIETVRTGQARVVRGWSFARASEPVEFWFMTGCNIIVVVGVLWIALSGW